jgi:hypothetical protein
LLSRNGQRRFASTGHRYFGALRYGFDGVHQAEETFGERRVDVDGAFQHRVGCASQHHGAKDLRDFSALNAQDGGAQIRSVSALTINFMKPSVSSRSMARATRDIA